MPTEAAAPAPSPAEALRGMSELEEERLEPYRDMINARKKEVADH